MSGLLALFDDIAAIAKVAAANLDDVATQAVKASSKAAGAVIDDAAVTPKYLQGFKPARELPIVWRIAVGSIRNKLLILLPAALLLSAFAPWLIMPLLMLGGAYLCFEGAEKVYHLFVPHKHHHEEAHEGGAPAELEEAKIAGAVKTDFILSAEIMTIILSALDQGGSIWFQAGALAFAGVMITVAVYGTVALIVKADDVGLWLAQNSSVGAIKAFGRGIVQFMPWLLKALMIIGTAAMIWVGGAIIVHGLHEMGLHHPYKEISAAAKWAGATFSSAPAAASWGVTAGLDGVFGLVVGLLTMPLVAKVIAPLYGRIKG